MMILFPNHPLHSREVESDYVAEAEAAQAAGLSVGVIDHDALCRGVVDRALRFVGAVDGPCLYRGWMMTAPQYADLWAGLMRLGGVPVTDPSQYSHCHHLPESFPRIAAKSPNTAWITNEQARIPTDPDWTAIVATAAQVGSGPCIIKDWVKSQKHAWKTACFIPDSQDPDAVKGIASRFIELQGDQLVGGLVFRRFVSLAILGHHPRSGMPLGAEVRSFWIDGQPTVVFPYWDEAPVTDLPEWTDFMEIGRSIPSRFFTMDVARTASGEWIIMELGDGQVAGLPNAELAPALYVGINHLMRTP